MAAGEIRRPRRPVEETADAVRPFSPDRGEIKGFHVLENPHRQSRRDRLSYHPYRAKDGRAHGGGLFRRRRACPACRDGGRGGAHRSVASGRELSGCGEHHRGRADARCRGHPPRLWLPVGKSGFRRPGRSRRVDLHRPVRRLHSRHGPEGRRQAPHGKSRRSGRAGLPRRGAGDRRARLQGARDRLSGAHQGARRRRRQGHAPRRSSRRFRRSAVGRAARSQGRLRRRPRAGGKICREAPPYRGPGVR